MSASAALYTIITGNAGVLTAMSTRLYPVNIPQKTTLPAAAYQRISGPRTLAHDGPTGLALARFQITVEASSYSSAESTAAAIVTAVDGYAATVGSVKVQEIQVENELDGWALGPERYTKRLDVVMLYVE